MYALNLNQDGNGDLCGPPVDLSRLIPSHLADLRRSGLSDLQIDACGFYSESDPLQLALVLHRKVPKKFGSALVIPFRGFDGKLNGFKRVKPDTPRKDHHDKPIKYESPTGEYNRVYLPPRTFTHLSDAGITLLITEGEKKAAKADQEGFCCIGLVGVFGWKKGRKADYCLLDELEVVVWKGRKVYLVFDSDAADKEDVRDAESRLAAQLKQRGAIVRVVRLPVGPNGEKVGLDDFLVTHDPPALHDLLNSAQEPEPVDAGIAKVRASDIDAMTEARRFLKQRFASRDDAGKLLTLRHWQGHYWRFDKTKWREVKNDEIRGQLIRCLDQCIFQLTRNSTSNVLDCIMAETLLGGSITQPHWLGKNPPFPVNEILAANNGLFHLPSLVASAEHSHPLTPRFFSPNALDYPLDLKAPAPIAWLGFLNQLWSDDPDAIETLQEWFGYCLLADTRLQKIMMLLGPRRSGKGTIARVLRALIGPDNVAGPTLAGLGTNFGLWPLLGKTVATISDARLSGRTDAAIVTERLLSISGEDAITVDRKCLEPVTTKLSARFTILTNELPRLGDSSCALVGRMIVLPLRLSFYGKEDSGLTDRLLTELPGILLWAIEGWRRLRERGHFVQPQSGAELLGDMEDLASPISVFLREECMVDPLAQVRISDLFFHWGKWCERKGKREPGTESMFGRDLRAALPALRVVNLRQDGGSRHRFYRGICIRGVERLERDPMESTRHEEE